MFSLLHLTLTTHHVLWENRSLPIAHSKSATKNSLTLTALLDGLAGVQYQLQF